MKQIFFLAASILVLGTSTVRAQDDMREKFIFGLKAGINRSNIYDKQGENFAADPKIGFAGGAFFAIPIGAFLGLQPEFLYSQKGYTASGTFLGSDYSYTRTTSYLDIPLQLQIKPSSYFAVLLGPQYSYLLSIKDTWTRGSSSTMTQQNIDNDNARKNILGATVGFDITIQHFLFSARACWDLQNNNGDGSSTVSRYRNTWLQGTVGIRF
jgi:hypothetical protein